MSSRSQLRPRWVAAGLLALYTLLYVAPLGVRPLSSPDEVRYGAISNEMIATGDWVSPRFNGARYFEKPILGYWLNSATMGALGQNSFALRLPTALSVGLTALVILWLTAHYATRKAAVLAAGIYLTTFIVAGIGTTAVFDTFLTLFLTAALAAYYAALAARSRRARLGYLLACGTACAAAFLTKGFLALAIPVLVAAPFLAVERRWRELITTSWLPIAAAAVLVAPWALWIHAREPDFWRYFFWVEHVRRFLAGDAQHSHPFWYFFAYAPFAGLPWIWTLPAALKGLRKPHASRSFVLYLAFWVLLPWLFFSASRGKLMTYVLPCFPPLSILLAIGLERYGELATRRAWRIGAAAVALIFLAALAALLASQTGALGRPPLYGPDEKATLVIAATCFFVGFAAAVWAVRCAGPDLPHAALGLAGAALFVPLALALPQTALDDFAPHELLTDAALRARSAIVVADAPTFGAVAWYTKRDDIYLLTPGELTYGLEYEDARDRNLQNGGLAHLLDEPRGASEIFIVVRPHNEAQIDVALPSDATRVQRGGLVRWHIPISKERVARE